MAESTFEGRRNKWGDAFCSRKWFGRTLIELLTEFFCAILIEKKNDFGIIDGLFIYR